jgi:polygalacturonase
LFTSPAASPAATPAAGAQAWSAKEEKALADSLAKLKEGTPNRWERVAQDVGGGKTPSACKKHAKEMKK